MSWHCLSSLTKRKFFSELSNNSLSANIFDQVPLLHYLYIAVTPLEGCHSQQIKICNLFVTCTWTNIAYCAFGVTVESASFLLQRIGKLSVRLHCVYPQIFDDFLNIDRLASGRQRGSTRLALMQEPPLTLRVWIRHICEFSSSSN